MLVLVLRIVLLSPNNVHSGLWKDGLDYVVEADGRLNSNLETHADVDAEEGLV